MNLSPAASVFAAVFSAVFAAALLLFLPLLYLSHFVSGVTDISGQLTTILAGIRRQKCMCRLRQGSRTGDTRGESRLIILLSTVGMAFANSGADQRKKTL
jgi:hypothetical protein